MIRRHVTVWGRVQGVFFRDSARRRARAEGLAGWVRNCADGRVEAVFEGPDDAVERLVAYCREGPDQAEVVQVEVAEEEPEGLSGFELR